MAESGTPWCAGRTRFRPALRYSCERRTLMAYPVAIPIPPGKTDAVRRLTAECLGARKSEYDDMQRRAGITEEAYWLQPDPEGDVLIVVGNSDQTDFLQIMAN